MSEPGVTTTSRMRVAFTLPIGYSISPTKLLELAVLAEQAGLRALTCSELASVNAFSMLGAIAARTSRIRLDTGIVAVSSRSVPLMAMAAATLADISGNRFVLGIGAGSPSVSGFHRRTFERPLATMTEAIRDLRLAIAGEVLPRWGRFRFAGIMSDPVPIHIAAMNEGMLDLAGRITDGVMLNFCGPEQAARMADRARSARTQAGITDPFEVSVTQWGYVGDPEVGRNAIKREMGPYLSVPTYRAAAIAMSTEDEVRAADKAWKAGGRQAAAKLFPEHIVDNLLVCGGRNELNERIEAFRQAGCDLVRFTSVTPEPGSDQSARALIKELGSI